MRGNFGCFKIADFLLIHSSVFSGYCFRSAVNQAILVVFAAWSAILPILPILRSPYISWPISPRSRSYSLNCSGGFWSRIDWITKSICLFPPPFSNNSSSLWRSCSQVLAVLSFLTLMGISFIALAQNKLGELLYLMNLRAPGNFF